ncbi:hypothetical protein AXF12_06940 [Capnocytophaga haemolytica]|nr:mechanosensitive ion channel domain-containing protein [Capnocytophaga haemolytica]AMD86228.1 hypothetical protein AXF12_06940 [Capnocytophaga haemolytica]
MHLRRLILLIFFTISAMTYAQKDSVSVQAIKKELAALKLYRQKDSVRIAMLMSEIERLVQQEKAVSKATLQVQVDDSLSMAEKRKEVERLSQQMRGKPVVFQNDTIYYLYASYGPYDIDTRVKYVEDKLTELYEDPYFKADSLKVKPLGEYLAVMYGNKAIADITSIDAVWENTTQEELANRYLGYIKHAIVKYQEQNSLKNILLRIGELCLVLVIAISVIWGINRLFRFLKNFCINSKNRFLKGFKIRNYELIKKQHMVKVLIKLLFVVRIIVLLFLFITIIPLIFDIFPSTRHLSRIILGWIIEPIKDIWFAVINYLPSLFNIIVIVLVTRYLLKIMRFFALEIERGILKIRGFYPEWARTTYHLARLMLLALALVVVFPHLPGSDSDAFKGISVFLGVLISFGSSSSISNAIAGVVISYMRPFQVGDWIKSGDIIGVVVEKNALVTHLRTFSNEDITIPNSTILSSATTNFSSIGKQQGLALSARVKVRYDYADNIVEELLLEAALKTCGISKIPHPYVLQISLGELNTVYELNAYTHTPDDMFFIKSDLVKNIQNTLKQANIEIFSTQYIEIRTNNQTSEENKKS